MVLEFNEISHAYGENRVLVDISFKAREGEVTCLLGPSGCGKSTLLRLAAGLMPVQSGTISSDGLVLAEPGKSLPPEKRPVGLVFQEGALFPHLTVAENIAFGVRGGEGEKTERVAELLPKIGLEGFADRYPHTLSGGQQQRVALARALCPRPGVLLLDEPFANIDSQLRRDLREETRRMLRDSGTAAILVTHDPEEALEMGDQIAVMGAGRIVQVGPPEALYDRPETATVAKMIGRGQSLKAVSDGEVIKTAFGLWPSSCLSSNAPESGDIELVVRQEVFDISPQTGECPVIDIRSAGQEQLIFLKGKDDSILRVQFPRQVRVKPGDKLALKPKEGMVFGFAVSQ